MYLAELKLWNFRKFGPSEAATDKPSVCIPFKKGMNVLIGENDSGKTAIIDSMKLLLKTHSRDWIWLEPDWARGHVLTFNMGAGSRLNIQHDWARGHVLTFNIDDAG